MLLKASARYQLFVFRSIFFQTSCCPVGSPREIYPRVHKEIINLNCMIFCCISTSLYHIPSEFAKMIGSMCGFMGAAIFIHNFEHSRCEWLNILCGILFLFRPGYVRLAEPYHLVPLESSDAPKHRI